MNEMPAPIPDVACVCFPDQECVCGISERALRNIIHGQVAFTPEQKEWALKEIDSVEGCTRKDYETGSDSDIALGVLHAWVDYARDKGVL